jgi:Flp pilus assembly pilin Flp
MIRHRLALLVTRATHGESGQDLLEYAMLVALIALVCIGAISTVGLTINGVFWTYISGVMNGL